MATYTPPVIANYNDNPPTNDGSQNFTDNGVDWDRHTDEIGDPLKNYIDAVNNETDDAFDIIDASRPISVLDYGATGDGTTNDSAAIQSAIDFLEANNGGTLYFPKGRYKCNITVEANNIQFVGESFTSLDSGNDNMLVANTTASPILTVGDGVTQINGFTCTNLSFNGESGASTRGILIYGATRCSFHNLDSSSFSVYCVGITSTASASVSHIYFSAFSLNASSDATSVALDMASGGSFVSALFFNNGTIQSNSSAKWAIENDGVSPLYLTNVWCSLEDGAGVNLLNSGQMVCNGVTFDSNNSTDVLINLDHNNFIQTSLNGVINIDGLIEFADTTTASWAGQGDVIRRKAGLYEPFIMSKLAFTNIALANNVEHVYAAVTVIYNQGDVLILESTSGDVRATPSTGIFEINGASAAAQLRLHNQAAGTDAYIQAGAGSPEGSVTGSLGDLYLNTSGGANTTLYVKESGTATNTGWIAK